MPKRRVFAITDVFVYESDYLVLADDEEHAEDVARNTDAPDYHSHECTEHLRTEVSHEVDLLYLQKISDGPRKRPYTIRLAPTLAGQNDPDAFHGYRVYSDRIDPQETRYLKSVWELVPAKETQA